MKSSARRRGRLRAETEKNVISAPHGGAAGLHCDFTAQRAVLCSPADAKRPRREAGPWKCAG